MKLEKNINILITNLSLLNPKNEQLNYVNEKNEQESVTGIMTNEAPIKLLIRDLENAEQHLDRIIYIASEQIKKEILNDNQKKIVQSNKLGTEEEYQNKKKWEKYFDFNTQKAKTHLQYINQSISDYCTTNNYTLPSLSDGTKNDEKEIGIIDIADKPEDVDVVKATNSVRKIIESISEEYKDTNINIYIESNGGIRYVLMMLINIINVIERNHKNVKLKEIYSMSFNQMGDKNEPVKVINTSMTYASMQLVSSVDEFINYGKISALKNYFNKRLEKENLELKKRIQNCMNKLEMIAEDLQLCRTEYIINHFYGENNIYEILNKFIADYKKDENANAVIFTMVIEIIIKEYSIIYPENWEEEKKDGNYIYGISNIIRWCINKDYIQQAVTFCSEILPKYFFDAEILVATDDFWKAIERFRKHYAKEYFALVQFLRYKLWENNIHKSISDLLKDLKINKQKQTEIMKNYRAFDFDLESVGIKELPEKLNDLYYRLNLTNLNERKNKLGNWFNNWYGKDRKNELKFKTSDKSEITYNELINSTEEGDKLFSYILSNRVFINNLIRNLVGEKVSEKIINRIKKLAKIIGIDENTFVKYVVKEMKWYYDYATYIDGVNIKINVDDLQLLNYIFGLYGVLKEQRNMTNHANLSDEDKIIALKPEQLKCVVEELLNNLEKIKSNNTK
jgi:hypothetical protein